MYYRKNDIYCWPLSSILHIRHLRQIQSSCHQFSLKKLSGQGPAVCHFFSGTSCTRSCTALHAHKSIKLVSFFSFLCHSSGASGPSHSAECAVFSGLPPSERPDFASWPFPTGDGPETSSSSGPRPPPCPAYSAVIPLRILALRESDPELWARVDLLMDHVDDMAEEEREMWEEVVVRLIREGCGFARYTPSEILRAVGVFLTNGVNQGQGAVNSQGLYPTFSFISHR